MWEGLTKKMDKKNQIFFLPSAGPGTRHFFCFFLPHYFFAGLIYYLKLHVQILHNFDFFCYILLVFFR